MMILIKVLSLRLSCLAPCSRWKVCAEDGPSLCVGCQLCWSIKLQVFPSLPGKSS